MLQVLLSVDVGHYGGNVDDGGGGGCDGDVGNKDSL